MEGSKLEDAKMYDAKLDDAAMMLPLAPLVNTVYFQWVWVD